ncbi:hypothetical protein MRB53_037302 [Persea americana]|nr:hypothetical protein MRB53_037302 [Persea americana]
MSTDLMTTPSRKIPLTSAHLRTPLRSSPRRRGTPVRLDATPIPCFQAPEQRFSTSVAIASPARAEVFQPQATVLRKYHAWERQPRTGPDKLRKIWKRFDAQTARVVAKISADHDSLKEEEPPASAGKVAKRLCLTDEVLPKMMDTPQTRDNKGRRWRGVAKTWDRRKSGLPHKAPAANQPQRRQSAHKTDVKPTSDINGLADLSGSEECCIATTHTELSARDFDVALKHAGDAHRTSDDDFDSDTSSAPDCSRGLDVQRQSVASVAAPEFGKGHAHPQPDRDASPIDEQTNVSDYHLSPAHQAENLSTVDESSIRQTPTGAENHQSEDCSSADGEGLQDCHAHHHGLEIDQPADRSTWIGHEWSYRHQPTEDFEIPGTAVEDMSAPRQHHEAVVADPTEVSDLAVEACEAMQGTLLSPRGNVRDSLAALSPYMSETAQMSPALHNGVIEESDAGDRVTWPLRLDPDSVLIAGFNGQDIQDVDLRAVQGVAESAIDVASDESDSTYRTSYDSDGAIIAEDDEILSPQVHDCQGHIDSDLATETTQVLLNDQINCDLQIQTANDADETDMLRARDSDMIKTALASPGKAQSEGETANTDTGEIATLTDVITPTTDSSNPASERQSSPPNIGSRRSTRSCIRKDETCSASAITVQRKANGDRMVIKKSEAQELSLLTRNNTRKNKGGALSVYARLAELRSQAMLKSHEQECVQGAADRRGVRWPEELVSGYQDARDATTHEASDGRRQATSSALINPRRARPRGTPVKPSARASVVVTEVSSGVSEELASQLQPQATQDQEAIRETTISGLRKARIPTPARKRVVADATHNRDNKENRPPPPPKMQKLNHVGIPQKMAATAQNASEGDKKTVALPRRLSSIPAPVERRTRVVRREVTK